MPEPLQYQPDYAVVPGVTLRSTLAAKGMTQADLATRAGLSLKHVNQIVQGAAPITPETALALEKVTGVPARSWSMLEANYRERITRAQDRQSLTAAQAWLKSLADKGDAAPRVASRDRGSRDAAGGGLSILRCGQPRKLGESVANAVGLVSAVAGLQER